MSCCKDVPENVLANTVLLASDQAHFNLSGYIKKHVTKWKATFISFTKTLNTASRSQLGALLHILVFMVLTSFF